MTSSAVFDSDARRNLVQKHPKLNGIDYLEVDTEPAAANQRVLRVYFMPPAPPAEDPADTPDLLAKVGKLLDALEQPDQRANITIGGGVRETDIKITNVTRDGDHLRIRVDRPGDFSDYTLTIKHGDIDPFFQTISFNFKAGCPSRFDCKPRQDCPPEVLTAPPIDYMAKDYDSFRQALIDFLPTIIPGWTERREADLGMSLLEMFAYVGDRLSYYQDAVANEAYLETARQRISVRRHARLIDYAMHDGMSAMTFVHFTVIAEVHLSGNTLSKIQVMTPPNALPFTSPALSDDLALKSVALDTADAVFEVLLRQDDQVDLRERYAEINLHPLLNTIEIYAWENDDAYLPRGATGAELACWHDPGEDIDYACALPLNAGDYLLFEEVLSPDTGAAADRDVTHRQVVRLTKVEPALDVLTGRAYSRVEWSAGDALKFPVCIATQDREGRQLRNVSVARGNLVAAYHGRTIQEAHAIPDPQKLVTSGLYELPPSLSGYRFSLAQAPLGYLPAADLSSMPVTALQALTPRTARPAVINLLETVGEGAAARSFAWSAVMPDLLASDRFAQDFVVETDNDNRALVRFGDNQFGLMPSAGAALTVDYRVGVGRVGNVGADTLLCFINDTTAPPLASIISVRNPIPAWGGTDPEGMESVKQTAPAAFHAESYRAVTEEDYALAAKKHPQVRNAVATFRWTGSWHTVFINIDPQNTNVPSDELKDSVRNWVYQVTLAGYDLEINEPIFVPLMIDLDVCAAAGYFPADVEQALYAALSNQRFADGSLGFFHPDNFTFDQPLYLSQLFAAVERVPGVESVKVTRFARRYEADREPSLPATRLNLDRGYIDAGRLEIIRLDNDPSFPENGILNITVRGGQ